MGQLKREKGCSTGLITNSEEQAFGETEQRWEQKARWWERESRSRSRSKDGVGCVRISLCVRVCNWIEGVQKGEGKGIGMGDDEHAGTVEGVQRSRLCHLAS